MMARPLVLPDWRGRAVVCIASGPSLTAADCELVRASGWPTIVTNSTFRSCQWADALYGFDSPWWRINIADVRTTFAGRCYTQALHPPKGVICARGDPKFRSFGNAGANSVSLAVAAGAMRVVMLGFDCAITDGRTHHHADHPAPLRNCDTLPRWPTQFERLARYSTKRAVVLNASRHTALTCFERAPIEDALR